MGTTKRNKCNGLILGLIVLYMIIIGGILYGIYLTINNEHCLLFNVSSPSTNIISNQCCGMAQISNGNSSEWLRFAVTALFISGAAYIIGIIIKSLRDLIENEQISRRYNN